MSEMAAAEKICSRCNGSGWILREEAGQRFASECECRKSGTRIAKWRAAGIPERYQECSFQTLNEVSLDESHKPNPWLPLAKRMAEEFADAYPFVDSGLLFLGGSGVGKTHLMIAILNEVTRSKGRQALYVNFADLLMKIQSTFKSDSSESKEDVIGPYIGVELLALDELGATKPSEFARDMLYALLNARYNHRKITVATSNFTDQLGPGERELLEDRIGCRLRSRLHEMCRNVELKGEDYRLKVLKADHRSANFRPSRHSQLKRK
jgi:DNA replication protein DnaC